MHGTLLFGAVVSRITHTYSLSNSRPKCSGLRLADQQAVAGCAELCTRQQATTIIVVTKAIKILCIPVALEANKLRDAQTFPLNLHLTIYRQKTLIASCSACTLEYPNAVAAAARPPNSPVNADTLLP
jgi:hypothetical protein